MSKDEKKYQQQLNILTYVLEDDEDIILLLDRLFKLNGFVGYLFFKDSDEFVKSLNEQVRICILDYYVDGPMDGNQVLKEALGINSRCKGIMVTGQQDDRVTAEFFHIGGFRYVSKRDKDYEKKLVDFYQEAIALVKKQIEMHEELKSEFQDLKTKRKTIETRTD